MRTAVLLAFLALPALAPDASARTWSKEWGVGAHPKIGVETTDARVTVHRGGAGSVKAHVEYTCNVWGLHTEVKEPRVVLEQAGDSIRIYARPRTHIAVFGGMSEKFRIEVTVPSDCDLSVRTGDGGVEVDPFVGNLDVQTGDGHIVVHGAKGTTRLWTGDGGIDADGLDGDLTARTSDGHLKATGRFDRLELKSGDGRVEVSVARGSKLLGPWEATSGDGGITLRIPRNLSAVLDAVAHEGHVHVELPINDRDEGSRHELRGALNGGTQPLRIRTGDGSITLALSE